MASFRDRYLKGKTTTARKTTPARTINRDAMRTERRQKTAAEKAASNRKKRAAGGVGSRAKYSKKVRKAVRNA